MGNIDKALGLSYVMDMEDLYQEILQVYLEEAPQMKADLENAFAAGDWDLYRTKVHALKSTSLNIGASALSEAAKECEFSCKRMAGEPTEGYAADNDIADGKEREVQFLKDRQAPLMEMFEAVIGEAQSMI